MPKSKSEVRPISGSKTSEKSTVGCGVTLTVVAVVEVVVDFVVVAAVVAVVAVGAFDIDCAGVGLNV